MTSSSLLTSRFTSRPDLISPIRYTIIISFQDKVTQAFPTFVNYRSIVGFGSDHVGGVNPGTDPWVGHGYVGCFNEFLYRLGYSVAAIFFWLLS